MALLDFKTCGQAVCYRNTPERFSSNLILRCFAVMCNFDIQGSNLRGDNLECTNICCKMKRL